ncbi:hypothetical protein KFE26_22035 [Shewanella sp. M16]|uniref:Uncharacterized protein n=1 Tax=Shewanella phage vB_SspM_M16-3 TaxID=2866684 RepID=A0AAE7WUW6_9CAUD|nr:hypothetical protein [Shewanella sp. M16]YP_010664534.1 hypothetical protein PQA72_gp38 [Shewanella phage vB_SspM_M16-3]MBS0044938.1 hypothetical protein [Shewanella sp. M16]QYW06328.1 hypothetical protein M163_p38 [Shewanella phage vB_SspM_M16-3]
METSNVLQESYNKTLDEFFEELYSFWDKVPDKIVSEFVKYFPTTIYLITSSGGDLSIFKKSLRCKVEGEIKNLKYSVNEFREKHSYVFLTSLHSLHSLPITYTTHDIIEKKYPIELKSYVDLFIKNITQQVLVDDKYNRWLRDDNPKLNHQDVIEFMKMPDVCISKLKNMQKIIDERSKCIQEKKEHEKLMKFEKARTAWEQA